MPILSAERLFGVEMGRYRRGGMTIVRVNPPTWAYRVPAIVAPFISSVSGLVDFPPPIIGLAAKQCAWIPANDESRHWR
jgi:hypothetical protein